MYRNSCDFVFLSIIFAPVLGSRQESYCSFAEVRSDAEKLGYCLKQQ